MVVQVLIQVGFESCSMFAIVSMRPIIINDVKTILVVTRKVGIGGIDITSYRDVLTKWNQAVQEMYAQCLHLPDKCLMVKYEDLGEL